MNRLILVGNGFDLAHGLKTDYNSFIVWYLKKCLTSAFESVKLTYVDELVTIDTIIPNHTLKFSENINIVVTGISDLVDHYYKKGMDELLDKEWLIIHEGAHILNPFKIRFNSGFFSTLVRNCSHSNWVAIENEFYTQLKECLKRPNIRTSLLVSLNNSLRAIIAQLETYLDTVDTNVSIPVYSNLLLPYQDQTRCMILNFNYTNTIEKYITASSMAKIEQFRNTKFELNYIHGKINDEHNPLVFGFGDELDEDYHGMEVTNNNAFFEYIKSFWYFKASNYSHLIEFLNQDEYEVTILGHSCGLSDRTLLSMVFEHDKCKGVRIMYYKSVNGNNYTNLTYEISRHFRDKIQMRKRLIPFPQCQLIPQIS